MWCTEISLQAATCHLRLWGTLTHHALLKCLVRLAMLFSGAQDKRHNNACMLCGLCDDPLRLIGVILRTVSMDHG